MKRIVVLLISILFVSISLSWAEDKQWGQFMQGNDRIDRLNQLHSRVEERLENRADFIDQLHNRAEARLDSATNLDPATKELLQTRIDNLYDNSMQSLDKMGTKIDNLYDNSLQRIQNNDALDNFTQINNRAEEMLKNASSNTNPYLQSDSALK